MPRPLDIAQPVASYILLLMRGLVCKILPATLLARKIVALVDSPPSITSSSHTKVRLRFVDTMIVPVLIPRLSFSSPPPAGAKWT